MASRLFGAAVLVVALASSAVATDPSYDSALGTDVIAQNVSLKDDAVSGTVVNRSQRALREVRLQISYVWMWSDEYHPGSDAPGRTEYYTISAAIPPGGSAPFTYRPNTPLPSRKDGRFIPSVSVVGVEEVVPPPQ